MTAKRLINASERLVDENGVTIEQAWLYFKQLGDLLGGDIQQQWPEYADLAALQAKIKNPEQGKMYGFVIGQGMAAYNGTDFVLASDYSTLIV